MTGSCQAARRVLSMCTMTTILWLAMLLLGANTFAQSTSITVNAFLSQDKATAGQPVRATVVLDLPAPWHVNANPASSLEFIPTTLTFEPNPTAAFGKIIYPPGKSVTVPWNDTPVSLYSGKTIFTVDVTVSGPTTLTGVLRYSEAMASIASIEGSPRTDTALYWRPV